MKKKAFTLTELLVVVVIIGVLSAVVLPKFTKMLEARKATEAEDIMAAVRNEQEARCTLWKDYTGDASKLASLPNGGSKHFNYALDKQGITATNGSGGYVLRIPSYTDGRICCASGCDKLNRDYPTCDELNPEAATCSVPLEEEPEGPNPDDGCSSEHQDGDVAHEEPCECGGMKYTRYRCVNKVWTTYEDDQCKDCNNPPDDKTDCTPGDTENEDCEECGSKTRTCGSDGKWGDWSKCPTKPGNYTCEECGEEIEATCDVSKGSWNEPDASQCKEACSDKTCKEEDKPENLTQDCHVEGDEKDKLCGEQVKEATCGKETDFKWKYPEEYGECKAVEGKCANDEGMTTCGDWYSEKAGQGGDHFCAEAKLILPDSLLDKAISADTSEEAYVGLCCGQCENPDEVLFPNAGWCCPKGKVPLMDKGWGECGDCSNLGSNYYFDGMKCSPRYTLQATTFPVILGEVYQNLVPSGDGCSFNFQADRVQACAMTGNKRTGWTVEPPSGYGGDDPCNKCNAGSAQCNVVACYDAQDLEEIKAKVKRASTNDYHMSVSGKGASGSKCEGSVWYDKDAWREIVGVNTGDAYLCGISQNGVWLSDLGVNTAYCSSCGGKSSTVTLWNATQMPTQQGGRCQTFYTTGDYTQSYGYFDYLNEDAFHRYVNDSGWTSSSEWRDAIEEANQRSADAMAAIYSNYQQSLVGATSSTVADMTGHYWMEFANDPNAALMLLEQYPWVENFSESEFLEKFGTGDAYTDQYTLQKYYYKNSNVAFDPSKVGGGSVDVIYQNGGYDDYAWKQYLDWMKRRTDATNNNLRHGANCPDTITACAAPIVYQVKGYTCRRSN